MLQIKNKVQIVAFIKLQKMTEAKFKVSMSHKIEHFREYKIKCKNVDENNLEIDLFSRFCYHLLKNHDYINPINSDYANVQKHLGTKAQIREKLELMKKHNTEKIFIRHCENEKETLCVLIWMETPNNFGICLNAEPKSKDSIEIDYFDLDTAFWFHIVK